MELLEPCKAMNHPRPATCRGKADTINQITPGKRPKSGATRLDCSSSGFRHYRIEPPIRELRV
jgi:hypothetical protein